MKKMLSVILALCMLLSLASLASAEEGRKTVSLWYHSGDAITDAYYQGVFESLNAAQDKYTFEYTSFAFKDFQEKFQMAVTTDTMPDVVSLGFSNISAFTAQDSILELTDDILAQVDNFAKVDAGLTTNLRNIASGVLYGIPFAYNQEVAYVNTSFLAEKGEEAPKTQKEYLALCEKYADPDGGTYFTTLRGVRPYDSMLAWLFTYTDGAGYDGAWFDENGKCILSRPEFVEAMDAYAGIYKNKWCSGDSVNNNYNEICAEFDSGVAAYLVHNSSSNTNHANALGADNFKAVTVLANDQGHYFASGLQPNVFCIAKSKNPDHDYSGAIALMNELLSTEVDGGLCAALGRVPCNMEVEQQDWYKESDLMMLCAGYLTDPNYKQILNPYWLADFSTMITTDMTADFQALLLGEITAEECMTKWAETIDEYQAEYLAEQGA